MAAAAVSSNPTSHHVSALLPKLYDADPDFRFMALSDLEKIFTVGHQGFLQHDYATCAKTIDGLIHALNDQNGEVQNMAIKCLGPFVNKVPENILCPMFDKVSTIEGPNIIDNTIPALALRSIVISLPRPVPGIPRSKAVQDAYSAVSRALIPRLIGKVIIASNRKDLPPPPKGMLRRDLEDGTDSNTIDVLTEVARCFGPMLQETEVQGLQRTTFEILESERAGSVLKKKAVIAISSLAIYFSDALLSNFLSRIMESMRDSMTPGRRKLHITILGSLARSIPRKFGPYLKTLAPFVLSALSEDEMEEEMASRGDNDEPDSEADEVREAALIALESFLASCSDDMRAYTKDAIDAAIRYLKWDPNVNEDVDDVEEADEDDAFDDEDFEEEQGFDDEDDSSWKARRCAAKVLFTLISTRSNGDLLEDGTLYGMVAPALIGRFKEREENVRLEVLAALSLLVRVTGGNWRVEMLSSDHSSPGSMGPPMSRKRRRGGSDASMFDTQTQASLSAGIAQPAQNGSTPTGPQASLAQLSQQIVGGAATLLKTSPLPTKQASIALIRDYVVARHGGLDAHLGDVMNPVVDAINTSGGNTGSSSGLSSATTANSFKIQALQLLGAVLDAHPSSALSPFMDRLVPAVVSAVRDRYSKPSVEALAAIEQVTKVLTPPRTATSGSENKVRLEKLFDAIAERITASDADLEVRQQAIRALGLLVGLTSGSSGLLSQDKRRAGLDLLKDRVRNELTRLASIRAIETVAVLAKTMDEYPPSWVSTVSLELGAQLRKASRVLRGASLSALKALAINPASAAHFDSKSVKGLLELLLPLLQTNDLHLLGPALEILTTFVKTNAKVVVDDNVIGSFRLICSQTITGHTLDALLVFVGTIGEQGVGAPLMRALLQDVGVSGNADLVGKLIGTLLVASGQRAGVTLQDFVNELNTAQDAKRSCLALAVLGEAALRMGAKSPLKPKTFTDHFKSKSEKVRLTAAVALGRAGAGDIQSFLPTILAEINKPSAPQYLLLHSIREVLQHQGTEENILPHAGALWQNLIKASQAEDNRAIGAECMGRLAIIDPKTYLPQLQTFLTNRDPGVRGMVISALRYTLADTDETFDDYLRPGVVDMLTTMLNETDLENRRLALTTLKSAAHNKPDLILPSLDKLLPLAMKETVIKPELVREVQMGPFKHKVDDGLEIRKSAYETLYALLESAFPRLSVPDFYDRIIAGIGDEHDIRILCNLMLSKLIVLAPEETHTRLESLAEHFKAVLATKAKENAVKQELEKMAEASKGVLKVSVQLNKALMEDEKGAEDAQGRSWTLYWEWVKKEFAAPLKVAEDEVKEKDR